ncbi:putative disease resistance protein RGA3 [Vitis vinifera]|uniref:Putative disease resistance protein RGA3 n=1 Tax=Vitis vinifera TaxID=29760 RepID=A0A438DMN8_VITVI|nr:putative disease resistance protein RGA3 [Vitis vinifera]
MSELKELNNLRGGLWIQGLENVRDVVLESREANLGEKQHIQSLRLNWRRSGAQSSEDVESVLEGLQPHRNLKKLCIEGYGGIRFPSWMMNGGLSSMLPNLTTVNLEGCSRCQTLPCFVRLPHLKSLQLDDLEKVEYMECSSEGPFFPSLENLNVNRMPKLKELWRRGLPTHPPPSLPCLSKLKIYFCDELASLELHSSPLLSQLEVVFCDELASLELHSSPLLSILEIHHCPKLTSLLLPQSPLLSRLDIRFCGDLASLELHSSPLLSSLKIFDCPKLTSVQASSLPCLKELKLMKVRDEVLRQSLLVTASSLESVSIERIDDLITLPDELHQHASTLQTLEIWICTRLATLPHWIGNLSSLTQLRICDCPKLTSCQKRCVPSLPSTYSNSLVVHTYSKDAKGQWKRCVPWQPSTYSKSPTVHTYPEDAKGKMVKIGPRLLMSQTLVLIGYGSDAESHFSCCVLMCLSQVIPNHYLEASKAISMVWPSVVDCPDMKALPEKMRCEPTVYA